MQIVYFSRWNKLTRRMADILTIEQAKESHKQEIPYCVAYMEGDEPSRFIQINFQDYFCNLILIDGRRRKTYQASFQQIGQMLFLGHIFEWQYENGGSSSKSCHDVLFERDGSYVKNELVDGVVVKTLTGKFEANGLVFESIGFGRYDSILERTVRV